MKEETPGARVHGDSSLIKLRYHLDISSLYKHISLVVLWLKAISVNVVDR